MNIIGEARKLMEAGGVIVYPTETAYGIGCNALDEQAVEKVYEAKERPHSKGLTVICSSVDQVEKYAELTDKERRLVGEFMPGPLTLVVKKKDNVPENLNDSFVFRISSSDTARNLAEEFPIVATSANISGNSTSYRVEDISEDLLDNVDMIINEGELKDGPTSTIAEVMNGEVLIHRKGPVKEEELRNVLTE